MSYRDDLDASQARADALEDELEREKAAHAKDAARIAELEENAKQVHEPPARPVAKPKPRPERRAPAGVSWLQRLTLPVAILAVAIVGVLVIRHFVLKHMRIADGWDVDMFLGEAYDEARDMDSDAELVSFRATAVDAAGRAHVETSLGHLGFVFRVPSLAAYRAPADRPGGERGDLPKCEIDSDIWRTDDAWLTTAHRKPHHDCFAPSIKGRPRCSVVEIWKRAIAAGTPANGIADVIFTAPDDWYIGLRNEHGLTFSDDCP